MSLETDIENAFKTQPLWRPSDLYAWLCCYLSMDAVKSVLFDLLLQDRLTIRSSWKAGEEPMLHGLFGPGGNASPDDEPAAEEEGSETRVWIVRELKGMFRRQDRWRPDQILSHFTDDPWDVSSDEVSSAVADLIFDGRLRVQYKDEPGNLLHLVAVAPWPPRQDAPDKGKTDDASYQELQRLRGSCVALEKDLEYERKLYDVMKLALERAVPHYVHLQGWVRSFVWDVFHSAREFLGEDYEHIEMR